MPKYDVTIQKLYDHSFEIEAENEIDAVNKANEKFNALELYGNEMYEYNEAVKELEE